MNYKSFNLGDWIGHISGVIEDETTLDGNEMRDLVEFLSTLKQEPCEDAISRKALHEALYERFHDEDASNNITEVKLGEVRNFVKDFPSVTPTRCIATVKFSKEDMRELIDEKMKEIVVERKKGKWIGTCRIGFGEFADCEVELIGGFVADNCHCSECGEELEKGERGIYCPNCGCKMSK